MCRVISLVLTCISLMASGVEHLLTCCWPYCLLWRNVYSSLFCVLKIRWLCCCWSVTSLYILDINPLSGTRLADIFPHFLGLLFHSVDMVSFDAQVEYFQRSSSSLSRSLSMLKDYSGEGLPWWFSG